MKFEQVLPLLKQGKKLRRKYWKDVFIQIYHDDTGELTNEFIVMTRRDEKFVMEISTESILAEDWEVID